MLKKIIRIVTNQDFDEKAYEDNYAQIAKNNIGFYESYNWIMVGLLTMLYISTFFSDYAKALSYIYLFYRA